MEKPASPKNRKSGNKTVDKAKSPSGVREAKTGRFLLPSNTPPKDVPFRLKKGSDYVIFANPSRTDDEAIETLQSRRSRRKRYHTRKKPSRTVSSIR